MTSTHWLRLGKYLRETQLIGSIHSTLYWDQNTVKPKSSAPWRGEQLSLLARILHERQSSNEFEELILEASGELQHATSLDSTEKEERLRNDFSKFISSFLSYFRSTIHFSS